MNFPVEITVAPNVQLLKPKVEQAADLFKVVDRNRAHLRRWLPWVDATHSMADSLAAIEDFLRFESAEQKFVRFIFVNKQLAGVMDFHNLDHRVAKADMGYWLAEEFEGKGIITAAGKVFIEKGFEVLNFNKIAIRIIIDNARSIAVTERLGFQLEGVLRQEFPLNGKYVDLKMFGKLRN